MAVKVSKPGGWDYLLAAFAGGAKGVQTGLQTKQEREQAAAVQKALTDYRTATVDIAQQRIDIGQEQFDIEQATRAKEFEATQTLQRALGMTFPQRRTLARIQKGLPTEPVDYFMQLLGGGAISPQDRALIEQRKASAVASLASAEESRADAENQKLLTERERNKETLDWEKFDWQKMDAASQTELELAKLNLNAKNQLVLSQYNNMAKMVAARDPANITLRMDAYMLYMAITNATNPALSGSERRAAMETFDTVSKMTNKHIKEILPGSDLQFGQMDWDDGGFWGRGKPAYTPGAPSKLPLPFLPMPIPGRIDQAPGGGFNVIPPQFGVGPQLPAKIQAAVEVAITTGVPVPFSKTVKAGLKKQGYSDAEIKQIEGALTK